MEDNSYVDEYMDRVLAVNMMDVQALSLEELKSATVTDTTLTQLLSIVETGKWPASLHKTLQPYKQCADELSAYDGLLLRGNRIVLPSAHIQQALKIAHETHQGIVRTKQFLRSKFYWPNMDMDAERMIRNCNACVLNQPLYEDQPLHPLELPPRPWTKLGVDLVGPIENVYLLTVIDYYTSYPEVVVINDITSETVTKEMMKIFARFGYPLEVVTDNGKQFVGKVFEAFLKTSGVKHIKASPYYPKSNGKIERFHRYLKKAFKAAKSEGRKWREELSKILLAYRSTPHRASGETPANLMFGRDVRTKLPSLLTESRDTKDIESHHKLYKEKMKQYADMTNRVKEHNFKLG